MVNDTTGGLSGESLKYPPYQFNAATTKASDSETKIKDDFLPVEHNDVEKLNESLEKAVSLSSGSNQDKFVTVLILANHVEYLAKDILKDLRRMIRISAYNSYNGTIFWPTKEFFNTKNKDIEKFMFGEIIEELNQFNFPDKEDFLKCLSQFNKKRIPLIHKLLDQNLVENLQIQEILNIFNNIFSRYKVISTELRKKWPMEK